jgi:hypothetical protein
MQIQEVYKSLGNFLNSRAEQYNFRVTDAIPAGKPARTGSGVREYRLQLIDKGRDTSEALKTSFLKILEKDKTISSVKYNEISPNSSKYPSVSFSYNAGTHTVKADVVIARGANKGENFEKKVVSDLQSAFRGSGITVEYANLIKRLTEANESFASNEIKKVYQRTGSTKKEGVPIERLNEVIGDIVIEESSSKKWYISLKDVNGDTFSSYSGAASLMNQDGTLNPKSQGADFLRSFGVDLNQVQEGYDTRKYPPNKVPLRKKIPVVKSNSTDIKDIFERAWGMNYFYVRKSNSSVWKVFWLDRKSLTKLSSNIKVTEIRYPSKASKQITIYCSNQYADYVIEVRNSKAGEYPNDIKFKAKKLVTTSL